MAACRMEEKAAQHQSVLLAEVVEHLAIKPDGIYVDGTFGRGGHSQAILNKLGQQGRLIAIDKDPTAIEHALKTLGDDKRFSIHYGSFSHLEKILKEENVFGRVDGILLDLGVSSPQLDTPERGFSFLREGVLDMRMDFAKGISASDWLAAISEAELATILWEYGEERYSRRIARAVVKARELSPIKTTTQLAEIVAAAHPAWEKGKHPATQSFQAIRIAINEELKELDIVLAQSLESLMIHGRLLVISFHSLEDRIVKHFIQNHERGNQFPPGLPIKQENIRPRLKRVGRAIKANPAEILVNPRARSAVLRIAEKLL